MDKKDLRLLNRNGWEVDCENPFEISHDETGSRATLLAADCVLQALREEEADTETDTVAGLRKILGIANDLLEIEEGGK